MKISPAPLRLFALVTLSIFLTGCGTNRLLGKWTLDRERTLEAMNVDASSSEAKGFLGDLVSGLQKGLSRVMLAQFDGVVLEFTAEELRTLRNGVGEARAYEIIERPEPGHYVVQYADGEIVTWKRVDSGLAMKLPGDEEQWVWFSPVE